MTKAKNPKHIFTTVTRARIAEIEKEINIDIKVKTVMIDIEDAPVFSESTRVDVELIAKLMKLAGMTSSLSGMKGINNNLSSSYQRKVNNNILIYKESQTFTRGGQ